MYSKRTVNIIEPTGGHLTYSRVRVCFAMALCNVVIYTTILFTSANVVSVYQALNPLLQIRRLIKKEERGQKKQYVATIPGPIKEDGEKDQPFLPPFWV